MNRRFLAITLVFVSLGTQWVSPAVAQDRELEHPVVSSGPEQVSAAEAGFDVTQADTPWRAGVYGDGTPWAVYGDVTAFEVPEGLARMAEGIGPNETATKEEVTAVAARYSWSCLVLPADTTTLSGGWLRGTLDITCIGNYDRHRATWRHERSSWSHWRDFSDMTQTSWVRGELNTPIFSRCDSSGGWYHYCSEFFHQVRVSPGDVRTSPVYHGTRSPVKYKCGTREI